MKETRGSHCGSVDHWEAFASVWWKRASTLHEDMYGNPWGQISVLGLNEQVYFNTTIHMLHSMEFGNLQTVPDGLSWSIRPLRGLKTEQVCELILDQLVASKISTILEDPWNNLVVFFPPWNYMSPIKESTPLTTLSDEGQPVISRPQKEALQQQPFTPLHKILNHKIRHHNNCVTSGSDISIRVHKIPNHQH